jgi:hypothetical protein
VSELISARSSKIDLTFRQRIIVLEHNFAIKSFVLCQQDFQELFPNEPVLNKSAVNRLSEPGCVLNWKGDCRRVVLTQVTGNTLEDARPSLL